MSIRIKIILVFLGVVALSAGFYRAHWLPSVQRTAEAEAVAMTRRHLAMIEGVLVPVNGKSRLADIREKLDSQRKVNPDWLAITLHDSRGRRLYPIADAPLPQGKRIRTFVHPIRAEDGVLGQISVTVDLSHVIDLHLADYHSLAIKLGGGLLLFLLCLGAVLEVLVSRPVESLAEASNQLARGNFDPVLPARRSDEIGALVTNFAAMRDRIRANQEALRKARDDLETRVLERTLDLHETNEALLRSEAAFRDFAESASDRFWDCDSNYRITHRWDSDQVDKRLPRNQFTGRRYWEIHSGSSIERLREVMEKNASFRDQEVEITPYRGKRRFRRISGKAVHDELGAFAGYRIVSRDMSEEVALRLAADELARRLASITEYLPTAISLKDLEGRYQFVNRRFVEWYGPMAAEAVGRTSHDLFPAQMADSYVALDRQVQETGQANSREREFVGPDGGKRCLYTTKFPVRDAEGVLIGVGTVNVDVTDMRNVEQQLRQAQKMEAVGQLTGGVAHDFNNLLTVVLGNLDILSRRLERAEEKDLAQRSMAAAQRGAALTQQLLAYSRKQTLAPRIIDAAEHVGGMIVMLQRTMGEAIEIDLRAEDEGWRCEADPAQLETAILNLVLNARDAMPQGGRLAIGTRSTRLATPFTVGPYTVPAGDYVEISIADSGVGIPADVMEHVFEPFFTTKEVGEGSGLGLSMVYGFIKQSGGHVTVTSEPGVGTTFNIYLPRCKRSDEPALSDGAQSALTPYCGEGARILLVEDDPDVGSLIIQMLHRLGHKAVAARTGQQALTLLDTDPDFDILFSDIVLPGGMNGVEVAAAARARVSGLRVIYMSGYTDDELIRLGAGGEDAGFLAKPFQFAALSEALDAAFSSKDAHATG